MTVTQSLSPDEPVLLFRVEEGVATLTLNRPKQYNALSEALLSAIETSLDDIADKPDIRVVVIAGAGPAFCAGHDLKEMRANPSREYYENLFGRCGRMMMGIAQLPQPVIARVHGLATAAGCQLAAACDLAVAAESARFAVSGINLGLFCSTPAVVLTRNILRKRAFEMLVTGDFVDAETAMEYGLVNRVAPMGALDSTLDDLVKTILGKSAIALEMGKRMFHEQFKYDWEAAYRYAGRIMAANMMTDDAARGIDDFLAGR
uniref:Enoyl-CoA hydratase domain-containing protein 3, mitochondrial n=1 Tax=Candidatus Kentrum sp. TC TaxID=2126339 RepID=A0A450YZE0_9GAMM|nr:MAG: Enoyl-CoA hydratase/carnithine racemase [Candidatus Kentron sp. TC]VFK46887.1 MAG: Enoyl-CoA hydratase/carnithine racemase [Candidatus Kentron sp. TC]VFK55514.1 MAG: Enoyl-CoA hydratase/carnithine racemase [Candidatus Kentron sp. TC]